jgi:hypothetical protein
MLKKEATRREFLQIASMAAASLALGGYASSKLTDKLAEGKNSGTWRYH